MDEEEGKTMTEAKYQTQMMPATHHDHTKVKAKTFSNVADTLHTIPLKTEGKYKDQKSSIKMSVRPHSSNTTIKTKETRNLRSHALKITHPNKVMEKRRSFLI